MCTKKGKNTVWIAMIVSLVLIIAVLRLMCIKHEYNNHPDEKVFIHASVALKDKVLGVAEYSELKEYPEGSYFFYFPFQILAHILENASVAHISAGLWNRIGAVLYSVLGIVLGITVLRYMHGSNTTVLLYLILNAFSLFQIEQSRYGTGDPITFPLLMLCIYLLLRWLNEESDILWYSSCFIVGVLASVKYPLVYFAVLPIIALLFRIEGYSKAFDMVFFGIVFIVTGFMLFSPGVMKDLDYISRVCKRELDAYIYAGNVTEDGGILNHFFSMLVYWLLYADCILAIPFFCRGSFGINVRCDKGLRKESILYFKWVLPCVILVFLGYNAFVRTLFMRTIYPFFCVALLYTSVGVELVIQNKRRRVIALCIVAFTVIRGLTFLEAYRQADDNKEYIMNCIDEALDISKTDRVVILGSDTYFSGNMKNEELFSLADCITRDELMKKGFPSISSGDIVLTGSLEFGKAGRYCFPIKNDHLKIFIQSWEMFKTENREGYIGQSYPQYYGYLYGFWIKGTNASEYDFPMNYVYLIR